MCFTCVSLLHPLVYISLLLSIVAAVRIWVLLWVLILLWVLSVGCLGFGLNKNWELPDPCVLLSEERMYQWKEKFYSASSSCLAIHPPIKNKNPSLGIHHTWNNQIMLVWLKHISQFKSKRKPVTTMGVLKVKTDPSITVKSRSTPASLHPSLTETGRDVLHRTSLTGELIKRSWSVGSEVSWKWFNTNKLKECIFIQGQRQQTSQTRCALNALTVLH